MRLGEEVEVGEFSVYRSHYGGYVIRPKGTVGTCGFHPKSWKAVWVRARTPEEAVRKRGHEVFDLPRPAPGPAPRPR